MSQDMGDKIDNMTLDVRGVAATLTMMSVAFENENRATPRVVSQALYGLARTLERACEDLEREDINVVKLIKAAA